MPVETGRDAARSAAQRELSNPAYHQQQGNWLERAFQWLWDRLGDLLDHAAGAAPGGLVGLTVALLLVGLLLAALVWRLGRPVAGRRPPAADVFGGRRHTAAEHRTAAEQHAASGDWTAAARERMRAIVRSLEERAVLDERPGRTADEAARAAGRRLPEQEAALRAAARRFDDIEYGGRTAGEADYISLTRLDDSLVRARAVETAADPAPGKATARSAIGPGSSAAQDDAPTGRRPEDAAEKAVAWQPPGGTR